MSHPSPQSLPNRPQIAASYERCAMHDPLVIHEQYARNRTRALEDGYDIPDSPGFRFTDNGLAGNGDPMCRPGFRALADAIEKEGRITRVYMRDLYRLGRWQDLRESLQWQMWFLERGISLCCGDYIANSADVLHALADLVQTPQRPALRGRDQRGPTRKKEQ